MKYVARFESTLDGAWRGVRSLCIGRPTTDAPAYVLVERDDQPVLVIALNADRPAAYVFQEALVWKASVVIGYGDSVHLVSLSSLDVATYVLDGYFGHLYPLGDALLVADASFLWCINGDHSNAWRSKPLGVDGVIVESVEGGVVHGQAEHDPPGGWRPFSVSLATGELVDVR